MWLRFLSEWTRLFSFYVSQRYKLRTGIKDQEYWALKVIFSGIVSRRTIKLKEPIKEAFRESINA